MARMVKQQGSSNQNNSQSGQDLAEYALLIGLIALIVVGAITILGQGLDNVFTEIAGAIQSGL
jgi:pilus assembly protein Flp/PilA